jgi:hypothetical protein
VIYDLDTRASVKGEAQNVRCIGGRTANYGDDEQSAHRAFPWPPASSFAAFPHLAVGGLNRSPPTITQA